MKKNKTVSQAQTRTAVSEASRQARIRAIKEAIAAGTYRIGQDQLADSLLRHLLWEQWAGKRLQPRTS